MNQDAKLRLYAWRQAGRPEKLVGYNSWSAKDADALIWLRYADECGTAGSGFFMGGETSIPCAR